METAQPSIMNHSLLGIRFNQRISSLYLILPEHNSCPVRATFESLGTEKIESDNCNFIYQKMDLKILNKEHSEGSGWLRINSSTPLSQFLFLIHHTPSDTSEVALSLRPRTSKTNLPPLEKQMKRFAITDFAVRLQRNLLLKWKNLGDCFLHGDTERSLTLRDTSKPGFWNSQCSCGGHTHLNVCLTAPTRRSMIFSRSSREQVKSSVRSEFKSRAVILPSSSSSFTMLSVLGKDGKEVREKKDSTWWKTRPANSQTLPYSQPYPLEN